MRHISKDERKLSEAWQFSRVGAMIDILPIEDSKEHYSGDECWCSPLFLQVKTQKGTTRFITTHEPDDLREVITRDVAQRDLLKHYTQH